MSTDFPESQHGDPTLGDRQIVFPTKLCPRRIPNASMSALGRFERESGAVPMPTELHQRLLLPVSQLRCFGRAQ